VNAIGTLMLDAHDAVTNAAPALTHDPNAFPGPGDPSPSGFPAYADSGEARLFFRALEGAVNLLLHTDCSIAGVEFGSFDTHRDQLLRLPALLRAIGWGMNSAWAATNGVINLTTLALSEFGRNARVNGTNGTDHGQGGVMIGCGAHIVPGVYNCDNVSWPGLTYQATLPAGALDQNAIPARTHFLAVFKEMCEKLYGVVNPTDLGFVLPGLNQSPPPATMRTLNFLQ
jgi:uncharacterized protein (DUF1501 family)